MAIFFEMLFDIWRMHVPRILNLHQLRFNEAP